MLSEIPLVSPFGVAGSLLELCRGAEAGEAAFFFVGGTKPPSLSGGQKRRCIAQNS